MSNLGSDDSIAPTTVIAAQNEKDEGHDPHTNQDPGE